MAVDRSSSSIKSKIILITIIIIGVIRMLIISIRRLFNYAFKNIFSMLFRDKEEKEKEMVMNKKKNDGNTDDDKNGDADNVFYEDSADMHSNDNLIDVDNVQQNKKIINNNTNKQSESEEIPLSATALPQSLAGNIQGGKSPLKSFDNVKSNESTLLTASLSSTSKQNSKRKRLNNNNNPNFSFRKNINQDYKHHFSYLIKFELKSESDNDATNYGFDFNKSDIAVNENNNNNSDNNSKNKISTGESTPAIGRSNSIGQNNNNNGINSNNNTAISLQTNEELEQKKEVELNQFALFNSQVTNFIAFLDKYRVFYEKIYPEREGPRSGNENVNQQKEQVNEDIIDSEAEERNEKVVFIKICPSFDSLLRAAEIRGVRKLNINTGLLEEFTVEEHDEFVPSHLNNESGKYKFFSSAERVVLTRDILCEDYSTVAGEYFRAQAGNKKGKKQKKYTSSSISSKKLQALSIISVKGIPLHNQSYVGNLLSKWVWSSQFLTEQPLDDVRAYLGEDVSFYFAFLGHYTKWLIAPSILGIALHYITPSFLEDFDGNGIPDSTTTIGTTIFAVFIAIWATNFLESWKRRQYELAFKWNVHDHEEVEEDRPEFRAAAKLAHSDLLNCDIYVIPWYRYLIGYTLSYLLCSLLVLVAAVSMILFLSLQDYVDQNWVGEEWSSFPWNYATLIPMIMYTFLITAFSMINQKLAVFTTTKLEIRRTESELRNAIVLKLVALQFVNYHISLFYTAFIKQDIGLLRSCLATLLIFQQGSEQFFEVFFPIMTATIGNAMDAANEILNKDTQSDSESSKKKENSYSFFKEIRDKSIKIFEPSRPSATKAAMEEMNLEEYIDTFNDYLEIWVQFGQATLFAAVFPLAALFALLNNIVEIRSDAFKILCASRRVFPVEVSGIGSWLEAFEFLGYLAVMTNMALIGVVMNSSITSTQMSPRDNMGIFHDRENIIVFLVIVEHLIIGFKVLVSIAIPDVPEDISYCLQLRKQQAYSRLHDDFAFRAQMRADALGNVPIVEDIDNIEEETKLLKRWALDQYQAKVTIEDEIRQLKTKKQAEKALSQIGNNPSPLHSKLTLFNMAAGLVCITLVFTGYYPHNQIKVAPREHYIPPTLSIENHMNTTWLDDVALSFLEWLKRR